VRCTGIVIAAAAVLLAGCGSSKTIVTVTRPLPATSTGSATTKSTTTSTAGTTGTTTTGSTATHTTPPPPPNPPSRLTVHLAEFSSPSGNIGCIIAAGQARCDIKNRNWSPPARPPGCPSQVGFGQGLFVNHAGVGHFVCAGDTAIIAGAPALHYGKNTLVDGFLCISRTTGMACEYEPTSHGFVIAIQGYRSF
jgi:hypothetical protein